MPYKDQNEGTHSQESDGSSKSPCLTRGYSIVRDGIPMNISTSTGRILRGVENTPAWYYSVNTRLFRHGMTSTSRPSKSWVLDYVDFAFIRSEIALVVRRDCV
jgi:hypothetical protein